MDNRPGFVDNAGPLWRKWPLSACGVGSRGPIRSTVRRVVSAIHMVAARLSPTEGRPSTLRSGSSTDLLSVAVRRTHILHIIITMMTR